jgi:hypothetical protein
MPLSRTLADARRLRFAAPSRAAVVLVVLALLLAVPGHSSERRTDGFRVADAQFWGMLTEFSEPDGYFHSDNLVSNELAFQRVIPTLRTGQTGGAYVGVGPDQNFTYLVAVQPRIAFIVDVRRQNALLHLLYKAVVELAPTRAEFLSRLFSRPEPRGLDRDGSAAALVAAFAKQAPDRALHERHLKDVIKRLTRAHRFPLPDDDQVVIRQIYDTFFDAGPEISYTVRGMEAFDAFPTYGELVQTTDDAGENHSYLASERHYETLRSLEERNLIVPIVGDFAGPKALRAVAQYLDARGLPVAAFYTSNVEFYLFRNGRWQEFAQNLARLPVNGQSVVIRTSFHNSGGYASGSPYPNSRTLLEPIPDLVRAFQDSLIRSYEDILERSR